MVDALVATDLTAEPHCGCVSVASLDVTVCCVPDPYEQVTETFPVNPPTVLTGILKVPVADVTVPDKRVVSDDVQLKLAGVQVPNLKN